MKSRPQIVSIAGFDPSAGAGLLADIKTAEMCKVYAHGVLTANTWQTDDSFARIEWAKDQDVLDQLALILNSYKVSFAKIGIIQSIDLLSDVLKLLSENKVKAIWDPVLKSSSGFNFGITPNQIEKVINDVFIITPNWDELKMISGEQDAETGAKNLAKHTKVYLKGGHNRVDLGKDYLFADDKIYSFNPKTNSIIPKHGSGCVFSTSLASMFARGFSQNKACLMAKDYTHRALKSNRSNLAYHS